MKEYIIARISCTDSKYGKVGDLIIIRNKVYNPIEFEPLTDAATEESAVEKLKEIEGYKNIQDWMNTLKKEKKIPKYILNLLKRRKIAAKNFITLTSKIDDWLERENIPITYVTKNGARLEDYTNTGCIPLCEPENGEEGFISIVEDFFKNKD